MSNLNVDPLEWMRRLFECENCAECGRDEKGHEAIEVMGNWFARCKPLKAHDLDAFTMQYAVTALWASTAGTDDEPEPMDKEYELDDLTHDTLLKMIADCKAFREANQKDLDVDPDETNGAHDFWLTRNHHGCGFWETPDWPKEEGERLTKACEKFGECNLYIGDDNKIHMQ